MWLPEDDGKFAVEGQLKPLQEKFFACFGRPISNKSLVEILMRNTVKELPGSNGFYICTLFAAGKYPFLENILEHLGIEFPIPCLVPNSDTTYLGWKM
jgi:hypothetical protein